MLQRPAAPYSCGSGLDLVTSPRRIITTGKDKMVTTESDVRTMCVTGHTVWLALADGSVTVLKTKTGEQVARLAPYQGYVWSLCLVVADTVEYIWAGLSNGDIEVYLAAARTPQALLSRHTGGVYCITEFSGFVFSGSNDFEIMQWNASTRVFMRQLSGHTNYVRALFAEGGLLISGSNDHTIRVWNIATGKEVGTGRFHQEGIGAICRTGPSIWTGDDAGAICVWTLESMDLEVRLQEHVGRVNTLKRAGGRVYSGGSDFEICIWDALKRSLISKISDHAGWVTSIVCPAQMTRYYMWSASAGRSVRCWFHDEYRVMAGDAERFDDVQWYNTEHTPYRDLNMRLSQELHVTQQELIELKHKVCNDVAALQAELERAREAHRRVAELEGLLGNTEERYAAREATIKGLESILTERDAQLNALTEKASRLTEEHGTMQVENTKLRAENDDLRRRLTLLETERNVAADSLKKVLEVRNPSGAPVYQAPLVVVGDTEAQSLAARLYKELQDSLKMNEAFRAEVMQYKTMLGITTSTPVVGAGLEETIRAAASSCRLELPDAETEVKAKVAGLTPKGRPHSATVRPPPAAPAPAAAATAKKAKRDGTYLDALANANRSDAERPGAVAVGEGYLGRGSHFASEDMRHYIQERYFSDRILFHSNRRGIGHKILSPRAPSAGCRCVGSKISSRPMKH